MFEHEIHGVMQPRENQNFGVARQAFMQNNYFSNLVSIEYYVSLIDPQVTCQG